MDSELRAAIRVGDIHQINKIRRRLGETGPHGPIFPGDRVKVIQYSENPELSSINGMVGVYRGSWKDGGQKLWDAWATGMLSHYFMNEAWVEFDLETWLIKYPLDKKVSPHQPVFKVELLED